VFHEKIRYAVMVPSTDESDWLYVTGGTGSDLKPKTYDTREEAEQAARIWKISKVVDFFE